MTVATILLAVLGAWILVSVVTAVAIGRAFAIAKRRGPSVARRPGRAARSASAVRHMVAVATGQIPIIRAQAPTH